MNSPFFEFWFLTFLQCFPLSAAPRCSLTSLLKQSLSGSGHTAPVSIFGSSYFHKTKPVFDCIAGGGRLDGTELKFGGGEMSMRRDYMSNATNYVMLLWGQQGQ